MKFNSLSLLIVMVTVFLTTTGDLFAGTGKVRFGEMTRGDCNGTGICHIGTTGAVTLFTYYQNTDTAGGTFTSLSMFVNFYDAVNNGFIGNLNGGSYVFTAGYVFNHPGDQGLGIPSTYFIPIGYKCDYDPAVAGERITLTVTQFTSNK